MRAFKPPLASKTCLRTPLLLTVFAAVLWVAFSAAGCEKDATPRPPAKAVMVEHTSGDSCLRGLDALSYGEGKPEVEVTVDGLLVTVVHKNAIFNCCLDSIEVELEHEETVLRLTETEAVTMPCDCICPFMVTATIEVPHQGTYTVEIWTGLELVWSQIIDV